MNVDIKNNAKVKSCSMFFHVQAHCPIGDSMYNADINIEYVPRDKLIDFETITDKVNKLNNASFIIEDLAAKVRDITRELSGAKKIKVTLSTSASNHCPVTVIL